ncbi:complement factor H-related protein 2-like [Anarhichas minor]|uniref:complement factor H-related protein 2-like n=1 Tax=Anarhichas minor TaxID=65739 RepID=UPI003F73CF7E
MEGEPYKTCMNGEWIGQIRCLKPCTVDEEAMRSHNIEFRYGSEHKRYSHHNDYITFSCTERRIPVGTSGMRFQCVDECLTLPDVPHANISEETKRIDYQGGHVIHFTCAPGYTTSGPTIRYVCTSEGWLAVQQESCSQTCKVAGVPDGVLLNTHVPDNQLRQGQNLRFECINPKDTLHGKALVECLAGGQWSDPFPTCGAPLGCGTSPSLTDGDTTEALRFQYCHEERVQYRCQNYYTMEGEPYKTCMNGKWIGQIRCLKPCTVDEEAMRSHNIEFRYGSEHKIYSHHNDHITFSCTKRRIPVGTSGMRFQCVDGEINLPTCQ